jgi:membrane protease YdiL (CAAX protease family)
MARPAEHTTAAISGKNILLTLAVWIVTSAVLGTLTFFGLRAIAPEWNADGPVVIVVAEVYFLFLAATFVVFGGLSGLRDTLNFRYTSVRDVFLGLGVWAVTLGLAILISFALSPLLGPWPENMRRVLHLATDVSRLPSADPILLFFILIRACLFAPLAEELLFRGMVFGWLRKRRSFLLSAFITTALFTIIHIYPVIFPVAFIVGFGAAWVRERTGSSFNFFIPHSANSALFLVTAYALNA